MGKAIDFEKQFLETVYINLPGPVEPEPGMSGGELLHGFLAELYNSPDEIKNYVSHLCRRWNVTYRQSPD